MRIKKFVRDTILFMNPESEWRYPRADSYLMYEFRNNGQHYATDFPAFKLNRRFIFNTALKYAPKDSIVGHCSVVQHTDKSFAVPNRHFAHAYYFINEIEGLISSEKFDLRKQMGYYDLRFNPSPDKQHFDKFIKPQKWYYFPKEVNTLVYPNPDSKYLYVEFIV